MKRFITLICASLLILCWISPALSSSNGRTDSELGIAISPQTLLLDADQGGDVTVHTSIPITQVNRTTLTLADIPAISVGADSLGHVVANFDEVAVKAVVSPPSAVLTLAGEYTDGTAFAGSDTVQVMPCPGR